jgi:IS5 family transposase
MIDGDVQVYVHYLRWLILQWENRNSDINCVATTVDDAIK